MIKRLMVVALTLLSTACATQQENASLECGAAGLGVGFLACKLAGGSDATCAAIGGAAALGVGALCYKLSDNLDKQRKELAGHENDLDARLRYIKAVNTASAKYNTDLQKQVVAITQHTDVVVQQIHDKTIDQKALDKERARLDAAVKDANQSVAAQQDAVDYMRSLQAEHAFKDHEYTEELQRQQQLLAQTRQTAQAVAAQRQRV
jgi:uncharacterized membrane protein YgaE (UPF0421/DUF939 family)